MIIWILALLLFACLGFVGYRMGGIRAACSLLGLLFASLLAFPFGRLLNPILPLIGIKNPFLIWITGPFIIFLVILIAFKIVGLFVHRKVDVYYKYKAGDLRMALWHRLNAKLGLCIGLANGAVYLILFSLVIYVFSYATVQMAVGDNATGMFKTLNLLGRQVQSSGMNKVATAVDPMPPSYYQAADVIGLIYQNDLLESRLSRYPAFLSLGERAEFQDIASDKEFTELRQRQPSFAEIANHPKAQAIINNPDLLREIWAAAEPNLKDLEAFLKTGQSARYDEEKILGRWTFDLNGVLALIKKNKPTLGSTEMQRLRALIGLALGNSTFIATPGKEAIIKKYGTVTPATKAKPQATVDYRNLQGQWSADGSNYQLAISEKPGLQVSVEGDRLTITGDTWPLRFSRNF
ncbi:MAG: hypothetical protein JWR19_3019 [Pedosphaera sp.]|nr:hypothetical protein [Pedosphaera sp.]